MAEHRFISDPRSNYHYRVGDTALFKLQGFLPNLQPAKASTQLKEDELAKGTNEWVNWGNDNLFPQNVMKDLRACTVGKRALNFRTRVHMGVKLDVFEWYRDEKNQLIRVPLQTGLDEIMELIELHDIGSTQRGIVADLETYHNAFPEILLNKKGGLYSYRRHRAAHVRYKAPDKNGRLTAVYVSQNWPTPAKDYREEVPLYDAYEPTKHPKFVVPLRYEGADDTPYYELSDWDPVRQNGWMDIAAMVPKMKKAIFENSGMIKYHIEIPYDYWPMRYTDWATKTIEEQKSLIDTELDRFVDTLFKVEASGRSVFTHFFVDENTKKEYGNWKITPLKNHFTEGQFNPDSKNANAEVAFAIGVPPILFGLLPGASESGSGSNINESFWVLQSTMSMDRQVSLRPLYILKHLLGWNKKAQFDYVDIIRDKSTNNATKEQSLKDNAN